MLPSNSVSGGTSWNLQDLTVSNVLLLESEAYYEVEGSKQGAELFDRLAGVYRTKDNNYIRIHTNFPQ